MKIKTIKPLEDRVLIKVLDEKQDKTASGIYLPDNANVEKPTLGKVVAVGDSDMIKVKKGDVVMFAKFSGTEIKVDNQDHVVLQSSDILATVEMAK